MEELTMSEEGIVGMILGFGIVILAVGFLLYCFYGYCYGRIFQKAGKPLWAGFVPIYNIYVLLEITGRPWWWLLVMIGSGFIPLVGTVVQIAVWILFMIDLAKSFGKDTTYGVLLGVLSPIMVPVLAFSDTAYIGPSAQQQPAA